MGREPMFGPPDPPRIPGHLGEPATPEQTAEVNSYWKRRKVWMDRAEAEFRESERERRDARDRYRDALESIARSVTDLDEAREMAQDALDGWTNAID